jgi:hypothetical protein
VGRDRRRRGHRGGIVSTGGIPDDVARFINANIDSVEQLEILLLLRASGTKEWTAESIARELRINPDSAGMRLAMMRGQGLLALVDEAGGTYRYEPASADTDRVVRALADTYAQRRVSVITLIFSKPNDSIRTFADAFKIRKKDS